MEGRQVDALRDWVIAEINARTGLRSYPPGEENVGSEFTTMDEADEKFRYLRALLMKDG